jgi:hypothetical protein
MNFPKGSILFPRHEKYNYIDSYGGIFTDMENKISIEAIVSDFTKPLPAWVDALMSLRDKIVSLVGFKTSQKERHDKQPRIVQLTVGEKMGFFTVYGRTDNEVILGEDDKHLNFRISILRDTLPNDSTKKSVAITTLVTYNNWMGPLYFFFVKPLHRLIVPAMLKKDFNGLVSSE